MRTLVITGASRGLGYHVARRALELGNQVIAVARSDAGLRELQMAWPASCYPVIGDITNVETKGILDSAIVKAGESVHMLINNAGTPGKGSSFLSTVPDQLYAEFGVHCVGPLLATQACAKYFEPGSIIVNITSRLGSIGRTSAGEFSTIETSYSYRIAKAAQNMLSLCFTQDPALTGVIVCGLHPGRIKSGCGRSDAPTEPAEAANRYMRWSESISKEMHGRCYDLNAGEMLW